MGNPEPNQRRQLADRITSVEELLMHLQHEFQQLSQVVLDLQRTVDTQAEHVLRLAKRIEVVNEDSSEGRTLEDDRPPHY